jgi:hypothetical protein
MVWRTTISATMAATAVIFWNFHGLHLFMSEKPEKDEGEDESDSLMRQQVPEQDQEIGTAMFRNTRDRILFVFKLHHDDKFSHVILCDSIGEILQTYDIPIPFNACKNAMVRAGWNLVRNE